MVSLLTLHIIHAFLHCNQDTVFKIWVKPCHSPVFKSLNWLSVLFHEYKNPNPYNRLGINLIILLCINLNRKVLNNMALWSLTSLLWENDFRKLCHIVNKKIKFLWSFSNGITRQTWLKLGTVSLVSVSNLTCLSIPPFFVWKYIPVIF